MGQEETDLHSLPTYTRSVCAGREKQGQDSLLTRGHTEEMPKHQGAGIPPPQSHSAKSPRGGRGRREPPKLIRVQDGYN